MFGNNQYGGAPYYTGAPYYSSGYPYHPHQSMNQSPSMNTNKLYATGIEDVRARQLPPNSDFIFLDNDKPIIYRKTTDATGKMNIQVFEIKPFQVEQPKSEPVIDPNQFASKKDFEDLREELEQLKESFSGKRKQAGKEGSV